MAGREPVSLRSVVLLFLGAAACGAAEQGGAGADAAASEASEAASGPSKVTSGQDAGTEQEAQAAREGKARIVVGDVELWVEVADDPEEREEGLMFRESLADDEGMLFVYGTQHTLSFWMKNTPLALDIAFIDASGRIVDIQQMEPFTERTHMSAQPAMYALEMRKGWFADHGVEVGDRVEF